MRGTRSLTLISLLAATAFVSSPRGFAAVPVSDPGSAAPGALLAQAETAPAAASDDRDAKVNALERQLQDLQREVQELRQLLRQNQAQPNAPNTPETTLPKAESPKPQATVPVTPSVKVGGYVQLRYESNQQREPRTDFRLRRIRPRFEYNPNPNATFVMQPQGEGGTFMLLDGYADLRTTHGGYVARIGQFVVPFGFEATENNTVRLAAERSKVVVALMPDDAHDRGLTFTRDVKGKPYFTLGVLNGNTINRDNNNEKDYVARASFPLGRKSALGASGYWGKASQFTTAAGVTTRTNTDKDRYGVDGQTLIGPLQLHAEYIAGRNLGARVNGGYVEAGWLYSGVRGGIPFVKYDWYDPNRGKANDSFRRWAVGYAYDLDKTTRFTLVQEFAKDQATPTKDNITTVQLQLKY